MPGRPPGRRPVSAPERKRRDGPGPRSEREPAQLSADDPGNRHARRKISRNGLGNTARIACPTGKPVPGCVTRSAQSRICNRAQGKFRHGWPGGKARRQGRPRTNRRIVLEPARESAGPAGACPSPDGFFISMTIDTGIYIAIMISAGWRCPEPGRPAPLVAVADGDRSDPPGGTKSKSHVQEGVAQAILLAPGRARASRALGVYSNAGAIPLPKSDASARKCESLLLRCMPAAGKRE